MKFSIYNWGMNSEVNAKLEKLGYILGEQVSMEVEDDIWKVAQEMYNNGLNVMICHYADTILFVDTDGFKQR